MHGIRFPNRCKNRCSCWCELEEVESGEDKRQIVDAILDRHLPRFSLTKTNRPPESE